ncbi:DUF992 domain-containing protein [Roseibium album]|uniref:DUF992 domain-containing protein n=1 Tax=Roseibium album TaxID=311410 RepID=UPI002491B222|nr:DUF992 domain-containing protein [Roseibium album]
MLNFARIAAVSAITLFAGGHVLAEEAKSTKLGVLECTIEGGFGLLLGSSKKATCSFEHADGTTEQYTGELSKLGLDIGVSGESYMTWIVFTPIGNEIGSDALKGKYAGITAGASVGLGVGANALIGGSNEKIALQPLSVEGKTGLNLAVGLSSLQLTPAG